jgi:putative ABC transport system permease protein
MDEVSFDKFHKKGDQIFRLTRDEYFHDGKLSNTDGNTGMMPGPAFASEVPEIAAFVRIQGERTAVKIGNNIFEQDGMYAESNFFSVFTFPFKTGNPATALSKMYSVVLSEDVAKKFFGSTDVLGKTIELPQGDDRSFQSFEVTGIVPVSPQNSSIRIDMVLPMSLNEREGRRDNQWISFYLNTFFVLNKGADITKVEAKMKDVYERQAKDQIAEAREKYNFKNSMVYRLQGLQDMHLSTTYGAYNGLTGASKPIYSKILGGIALFILIIACINFVNLTMARSLKRAKEIGIRKVVGGERTQLITQFMGESMLLSLCSFFLAILMVILVLPFFNTLSNKALSFSYLLDAKLIGGYIALFLFTSLLAGFYPALVLSGYDPVETLYNRTRFSGKNYLSKSLVVLQFALAAFLMVATISVYTQFNFLTNQPLGYNDKNIVILNTDGMKADKLSLFKSELQKDPSIESVAARQGGFWSTIAKTDGKDIDFTLQVYDTEYLSTYEIPLVMGRNLSPDFPSDSTSSVLVNEAFVKKAGWADPLNKQVDFFYDSIKYNVVGVVKDYHYASLLEDIRPELFIMHPKYNYGQLIIRIKPENTSSTLKHIEKVFKSLQPFRPYKYEFKDNSNRLQYEAEDKWKQIISFSAILSIFISCIGLFGLATLAAEKRTREIGIRKVLGASVSGIAFKLSKNFLQLVLVSIVAAFPAAWFVMHKWLENYPYRITIGPGIFITTALLVFLIALLTVSYQAVRAARANPVTSLRSE